MGENLSFVLAVNGGSSSVKVALFAGDRLEQILSVTVTGIATPAASMVVDGAGGSERVPLGSSVADPRAIADRN